jgi:hypothetical protein
MKKQVESEPLNAEEVDLIIKIYRPDLFVIDKALEAGKINPFLIPRIVRAISNVGFNGGYGKVVLYIEKNSIVNIEGVEKYLVREQIFVDNDKK